MPVNEQAIADLLSESMRAHLRAWECRRAKKAEEARANLQLAYDRRMEALEQDPQQTAAIWTTQAMDGPLKGVHLHESLMAFYRAQLGLTG